MNKNLVILGTYKSALFPTRLHIAVFSGDTDWRLPNRVPFPFLEFYQRSSKRGERSEMLSGCLSHLIHLSR
jgi:hypothetical protein